MNARHLFPLLLMPLLVSCTAHTYLNHFPAEPMFTGKEKVQAQAFVGLQHSELQVSGKIVNHLGVSANLYVGYFNINAFSQEYTIHGYTSLGKKLYGSLSGGYTRASAKSLIPVMNIPSNYGGRSRYQGFHFQPCLYFVHAYKKKNEPRELKFGFDVKVSRLKFNELTRHDSSIDQGDRVLSVEYVKLTQPTVYYTFTPCFMIQRTNAAGWFVKWYTGYTAVVTKSELNSKRSYEAVAAHYSSRQTIQYPRFIPLLIGASFGLIFK